MLRKSRRLQMAQICWQTDARNCTRPCHSKQATPGQPLLKAQVHWHRTKASPTTRSKIGNGLAGLPPPGHVTRAQPAALGNLAPYGNGHGHADDLEGGKDLPVKLYCRPSALSRYAARAVTATSPCSVRRPGRGRG